MTKLEKVMVTVLILFVGVMLGYAWRMHHEVKNWEKWSSQIRKDFMHQIFVDNALVSSWQNYVFIKRADGSVIIKRR